MNETELRAQLRQRIDDWFWSSSEVYASQAGPDAWRNGLVGYLMNGPDWTLMSRIRSDKEISAYGKAVTPTLSQEERESLKGLGQDEYERAVVKLLENRNKILHQELNDD